MKIIQLPILLLVLVAGLNVNGQILRVDNPSLNLTGGVGLSSYFGDLKEKNQPFSQSSFGAGVGLSYSLNGNTAFRADFGYAKVQGSDSKNSRADLKARNLSFKSSIWDFSIAAEYSFINIANGDHKFTPYILGGIGFCHFNPYTTDRTGAKVYLQPMGTEGQGLSAYPDRKLYPRTVLELPFGGGVRFAVSDRVMLGLEVKYRYLNTDFLDDVSNKGYPNQATLAAKSPTLPMLTYRGDELPGGAPYPAPTLNRGNPNNKDSYYTGQLTIVYRLKNFSSVEINY